MLRLWSALLMCGAIVSVIDVVCYWIVVAIVRYCYRCWCCSLLVRLLWLLLFVVGLVVSIWLLLSVLLLV